MCTFKWQWRLTEWDGLKLTLQTCEDLREVLRGSADEGKHNRGYILGRILNGSIAWSCEGLPAFVLIQWVSSGCVDLHLLNLHAHTHEVICAIRFALQFTEFWLWAMRSKHIDFMRLLSWWVWSLPNAIDEVVFINGYKMWHMVVNAYICSVLTLPSFLWDWLPSTEGWLHLTAGFSMFKIQPVNLLGFNIRETNLSWYV